MAIADGGYAGHPYQCSTPNNHNSISLKKFKSRALRNSVTPLRVIALRPCMEYTVIKIYRYVV